jgi:hypothetical protein
MTMEKTIKQAAIAANLSALRAVLENALVRAAIAEKAVMEGETNQAIGAALGVETLLDEARALFGAALALHRGGRP